MIRQWLLAALAFQFLAAYRAYRDEYNEHVGLNVLQADFPMKSETADQNDHSSRAIQTEKEAMAELANRWFPAIDISNTMNQCGASTEKQRFNVSKADSGFTFECKDGSVITLAIKKAAPSGAFTVERLNSALQHLGKMEAVILDGSKLTGHLNSLNFVPHLQRLQMRWCNMEGSLEDLKKYDLEALKLSGTKITGALQHLHLSKMKFLDLQGTSVTGSVSDDLPSSLKGLWLQNTNISGDIMALLERTKHLQYLNLVNSKVEGKIGDVQKDQLATELIEAKISGTAVTFNMSPTSDKDNSAFPSLTILEVSGNPLDMDVSNFLAPFRHCEALRTVKAANCGLTGELKDMKRFNNKPLHWKPAVIDLSHNNITALRGEPLECMLDVSNNPLLEVIDPHYFKTLLVLDIRETPFKMSALQAPGDLFENMSIKEPTLTQPTLTPHINYSCNGVKPKSSFKSYDILVSPQTFAPDELCQCAEGFAGIGTNCTQCLNRTEPIDPNSTEPTERINTCCGCKPGKAHIEDKMENVSRGCYKCHGPGCNVARCNRSCAPGYGGMLCSYCEEEYHETSRKECQKCPSDVAIWPLAVAAASCPMVLALAIWFWVFRPTTHDLLQETPWDRKGEFVEQALMFLSYIQVLRVLQNTVMVNVGVAFEFPSQLKIGDLLRALSLQCHLGHRVGKTVESLSSSFFLPLLCLVGLLAGFSRGNCFWGLKFVFIMISLLFVGTVQSTVTNAKCIYTDKDGLDLGTSAYFPEFPDHQCHESSALQVGLAGAILLNGVMIPGGLLLLGWFVSRRTTGVYTSLLNLRPVCICEQADDGVLLRIHTRKMNELGAAMEESLQMSAFYIHAAVFSVYVGQAIGSEKLQMSQINSDDSIALNVKVLAAEPSPESDLAVAKSQSHATWLSDTLAHRLASKVALLDYDEALWVGGWTLFKRYSLREVLWCEGLSKGCLFIVTALCTSKSTLPLAGISLLGLGLATANGSPFGSTSRNQMGSVFAICLGTTCFTACVEQTTETTMSICVLVTVAGVLPCLFWIHCQFMEADEVFQVQHLLAKLDKLGKGTTPTVEDFLEPITWDFEGQSAVGRLLATYRHVVKRIKQTASRLMFFQ